MLGSFYSTYGPFNWLIPISTKDGRSRVEWHYDLFEVDRGRSIWHSQAIGSMQVGFKLRELSESTPNECLAVHLQTNDVVARLNVRPANSQAPLIFQLAYDPKLALALSHELTLHGYQFGFAADNDVARAMLSKPMPCDLFIVGYAASEAARRDMAAWLKARYPRVPIIALSSPAEPTLAGADYNLELDSNDALLPTIAQALGAGRNGD
jgi:hypothetical protein